MAPKQTILMVDDQMSVRMLVQDYLTEEGYRVVVASNGQEALYAARHEEPDLILLDIMMPEMGGYDFIRAYRKEGETPIILLTAKLDESDKVLGLELGADDYVVKPFSPRELVERVKAILRRTSRRVEPVCVLRHADLVLDIDKRRVTLNEQPVELTAVEYKLLQALMSAPGKALSRDDLLNHIYRHGEAVVDRVVDVHIGHLRQKLADDPLAPRYIETVRGFGYRFSGSAR